VARILFTAPPLLGHLNPALAVAAALASQGHDIAWAVHTREIGERLPAGVRVYPLDDADAVPAKNAPQVRGLESVRLFFEDYAMPMAERALPPLEAAVSDFRPDVMAVDHQMPAGAWVARKHSVPWVTLVTTTASILRTSPVVQAWMAERYRDAQRRHLPSPLLADWPDLSPYRVIVFSIETLIGERYARAPGHYAFVGPVRGEKRQQVEFPWTWLRPDRRKLLVSLGTVSRDLDVRFFEVVMEAVAALPGVQAVLAAPESLAAKAPENVLVRSYVPQLELLERVDGVVCHAGHNTVCEALMCGLPLVVSPIRDDQPVIAQQVIDAGAALFLRHGKATPAAARVIIEQLLGRPELVANARRLASELRSAPGSAGAAGVIASIAAPPTPLPNRASAH
jgi:UDP:flavonoid glycosyltransferase YjiC (YdhE family)